MLYVLVLLAVTLLVAKRELFVRVDFWVILTVEAIGANVCFFAGPIAELYLTWLGLPRTMVRAGLFLVGALFAALLAWWCLTFWNLHMLWMPAPPV